MNKFKYRVALKPWVQIQGGWGNVSSPIIRQHPHQCFSWKWKNPHTMYSKPTQPGRTSANYADSAAQISSVGSIFS